MSSPARQFKMELDRLVAEGAITQEEATRRLVEHFQGYESAKVSLKEWQQRQRESR